MKKVIAIVMALVFTLSLGVEALAIKKYPGADKELVTLKPKSSETDAKEYDRKKFRSYEEYLDFLWYVRFYDYDYDDYVYYVRKGHKDIRRKDWKDDEETEHKVEIKADGSSVSTNVTHKTVGGKRVTTTIVTEITYENDEVKVYTYNTQEESKKKVLKSKGFHKKGKKGEKEDRRGDRWIAKDYTYKFDYFKKTT